MLDVVKNLSLDKYTWISVLQFMLYNTIPFASSVKEHYLLIGRNDSQCLLNEAQKSLLVSSVVVLINLLYFKPLLIIKALVSLVLALYFVLIFLRVYITIFATQAVEPGSQNALCELSERCPLVTMMLPLYKENAVLSQLINSILEVHYNNLEILFVLEEDDISTLNALDIALRNSLLCNYKKILVPYSFPRTKAKACNYALQFASGKYIAIFDAEDIIDPKQVAIAIAMLEYGEASYVQAKLNFYNADSNSLNTCFAIEYYILFNKLLRFCSKHALIFPLGGSSNYFRASDIINAGGWDSYNLTEDAEVGIHLGVSGLYGKVISSTTMEEAPDGISNWMTQRSRWIKGYLQTLLLFLRNPKSKQLSKSRYLMIQYFLIGQAVCYIIPPYLAFTISSLNSHTINQACFYLAILHVVHSCIQSFIYVRQNQNWTTGGLLLYSFYAILHVIAGQLALIKLCLEPYKWDKTQHGHSIKNYN